MHHQDWVLLLHRYQQQSDGPPAADAADPDLDTATGAGPREAGTGGDVYHGLLVSVVSPPHHPRRLYADWIA